MKRQKKLTDGVIVALPSFAVTAYARTGKDTFIKDVQQNTLKLMTPTDQTTRECKWCVYAVDTSHIVLLQVLTSCEHDVVRYAFADALKSKTHDILGLKNCPAGCFENVKNTCEMQDPQKVGVRRTMRAFYIKYGQRERAKNPNVWAEIVHQQIAQDQKNNTPHGIIDVISDFRFKNELLNRGSNKCMPFTIRLFRKDVPVADPVAHEDPEHSLDQYTTHFLLVPPGEAEIAAALKQFPQYALFELQTVLVH